MDDNQQHHYYGYQRPLYYYQLPAQILYNSLNSTSGKCPVYYAE